MATTVIMPKQGLMMTEGTIIRWMVKEGEPVVAGTPLFEMETDKLTITMDAEVSGTMLKIVHDAGDTVPITQVIAIVGEPGEDISSLLSGQTAPPDAEASAAAKPGEEKTAGVSDRPVETPPEGRVFISPRARMIAEERGIDYSSIVGTGNDGSIIERDILAYEASRPKITPLAKTVAGLSGIDPAEITGTGPNGRITLADLPAEGAASPAVPAAPDLPQRGQRTEPMSGMRKAIARNMLASKETNAQACHRMLVDMTAVIQLREAYKAQGIKVSYNDILIRICAQALREMPIVNASVSENSIVYHDYVNIGLAVSVPGGLIVPVVRDADALSITGIAEKTGELVGKAHNGTLSDADYHGGTFTVTSLGMYDVDDFVAIINPPESAILAVGRISKTPVVLTGRDGADEICVRPMCALCLSYDHRIIDGAEAAKFLQKIKRYVQNPALML